MGEFEGFDDDQLFLLDDGSAWLQDRYRYWYHYAYRPTAEIVRRDSRLYIEVCGQSIEVRETSVVAEGTIDGAFKGWHGDTEYTLTNGQIWKQSASKYEYKYAYRPTAIVFESSSGTAMAVEGTTALVRRVR